MSKPTKRQIAQATLELTKKHSTKQLATLLGAYLIENHRSNELDAIVREWLNTPLKDYKGLTPLQVIKKGNGQELVDAIKKADEECKEERSKNDGN